MSAVGTYVEVSSSGEDEFWLIQRLKDCYQQSKDAKAQMSTEWKRNYKITKNRAAPNIPAAPGTRANEIFPTVDSRIGWMTDQEILFTLTPAADPFNMQALVYDVLCEQLESVMNSLLRTQGWYAEIVEMLWDSAMYGSGFLKVVWDQGLSEGMGDVGLKAVSPWCLYPDPWATSFEDAAYVVEVHTLTAAEMERRYPMLGRQRIEEAVRFGDISSEHVPPQQFSGRQRQSALTPIGQGPTVPATTWGQPGGARNHRETEQGGVNVYECWIKENYAEEVPDPLTGGTTWAVIDQWRVVVHAGERVLIDELAINLFGIDRHPYVRYTDVISGELWGDPIVRDLAPCQQSLNTLLAMGQNNIVYTGNPMMVTTKGSGADRSTVFNRPGQIFDVNPTPGGGQASADPRWMQPPQLPQALMSFIAFWRDEMERIAGLAGAQRGEVPSGRATDKQVQATQEAGFIRIRSALRNLELTMRRAGELVANLIIRYYDTPRYVAIVGEDGQNTAMRLAAQNFYVPTRGPDRKWRSEPLRFALTVNAGSAKPTSRAARTAEAARLFEMKVVDDLYVLQAFQVSHAQQIMTRKQQQQMQQLQMAEALSQAGGRKDDNRSPRPKSDLPRPQ